MFPSPRLRFQTNLEADYRMIWQITSPFQRDLYLGFKILKYYRALWYEVGSAAGVDCRCVHYHFIVYQVAQSALRDFP